MIQRAGLRQARLLSSFANTRLSSSLPISRRPSPLHRIPQSIRPLPPRLAQRWVTTDAEEKTLPAEETVSTSTEAPKSAESKEEDPLKKELEAKNREIIDLKDKYLRSVADFRNLQERTRRDVDSARNFAIQRFASDLLDTIDNFDRALSAVPSEAIEPSSDDGTAPNQDLVNLYTGLKMTEGILMSTLKKHGLERFDPMEGEGRKFDPRLDEATFMTKVEGKEDGEVFHTQSKGFTLNGRVLRAAKVGVVKNS